MKTINSKFISYITGTSKHSINVLIKKYGEKFKEIGELKEVLFVENKNWLGGRPTVDYELNLDQALFLVTIMKNNSKVIEILFEYTKTKDIYKVFEKVEKISDQECSGFLYIIQKKNKLVKIGISKNPEKRISAIETHNGEKCVRKFISEKTIDYIKLESTMHKIFKDFRVMGEWFNIDFDEAVENYKTQVPMIEKLN